MPRTDLTRNPAPGGLDYDGLAIVWQAADTVNQNQFKLTGKEFVLARNTDGMNPHTVTINGPADPFGRTRDIAAVSIPANGFHVFGPFPQLDAWRQSDGNLYLEGSNVAIDFWVGVLP